MPIRNARPAPAHRRTGLDWAIGIACGLLVVAFVFSALVK